MRSNASSKLLAARLGIKRSQTEKWSAPPREELEFGVDGADDELNPDILCDPRTGVPVAESVLCRPDLGDMGGCCVRRSGDIGVDAANENALI
jgi:hypothetical protein